MVQFLTISLQVLIAELAGVAVCAAALFACWKAFGKK